MKVIFDHLNKTTLITSAYQVLKDGIEKQTKKNINPLTKEQIMYLDNSDTISSINKVYLGIKFRGNYVEFDDALSDVYISLLYRMKTTSPYFKQKIMENNSLFKYKENVIEIEKIESDIEECQYAMDEIINNLIIMEKKPKGSNNLYYLKSVEHLFKVKGDINKKIDKLSKERKNKIIEVFKLEGSPKEEKVKKYDFNIINL